MADEKKNPAADEGGDIGAPAKARKTPANSPKKKASGHSAGFCVYLGPSITGVIQKGTIFQGDKPKVVETLKDAVEKHPLIASLIASGDTLPEDRIKVNTPGNLLYVNYHKLAAGKK